MKRGTSANTALRWKITLHYHDHPCPTLPTWRPVHGFITDSTAFPSEPRGAFLVTLQLLMTTLDSVRAHCSPLWHYYRNSRASRIHCVSTMTKDWDAVWQHIRDLYVDQGKPLNEVREIIRLEYGFYAQ